MSERYLADTSTWIEALRPGGNPAARDWMDAALDRESVVMVHPVMAELLARTRTRTEYDDLRANLAAMEFLPIGDVEWEEAAKATFEMRRNGITIPLIDALIAVTALRNDSVLVHHDQHYDLATGVLRVKTLWVPTAPAR